MKEITFRAPHSLIKKIKAYNILIGGTSDLNRTIATLMEEIISTKIVEEATGVLADELTNPPEVNDPRSIFRSYRSAKSSDAAVFSEDTDATGISDGLGDDDDEDKDPSDKVEGTEDELAFVPPEGGVSDSELDHDMEVEKPNEEAKADYATFAEEFERSEAWDKTAEDIFTEMADLPKAPTVEEDMVRHRAAIRKKKTRSGRKAKVSSYNGEEAPEGVTLL